MFRESNERKRTVRLGGNFSKDRWGGAPQDADEQISLRGMNRTLQYEPRDLTISVEAGVVWSDLAGMLAKNRQMIPLDPPWFDQGTVGGVIAANLSGPRRRLYGTARDLVIGMTFVTMEGRAVQTGGMVVKNVAGLDMAKLMIGSFGTLAAIAVVNFKLAPIPTEARTFVAEFSTLDSAIVERDRILQSVLQPAAIDLLNPAASELIGRSGWVLAVEACGNRAVIERWSREMTAGSMDGQEADRFWESIREFPARFLDRHPEGCVTSHSTTISGVEEVTRKIQAPAIARAGSGVVYAHHQEAAGPLEPRADLAVMKRVKDLFDPHGLLNRGRLHGWI